jgi:hypothetical protein
MVIPIFGDHIIDHFLTALITEVDIDIRHADTVGVEKTLKEKPIF